MKNKPTIFSLSAIKSKSVVLALCMLPPLMFVYLYLITNTLQIKTNRTKTLVSAFLCSLCLTVFMLGSIYLFDELSVYQPLLHPPFIFILSGILIPLLALLIYASILSVNFERQFNPEYSYQNTDFDYLYRFCILLFLPLTIWYVHDVFLGYFNLQESVD